MTLPKDLLFLRHGQSEANIVQKSAEGFEVPSNFFNRHDSYMRLSTDGTSQADTAGDWLRNNGFERFDRYYVSPHIRTRETAAHLRLNGDWIIDDLWRERDWGEYGAGLKKTEQVKRFPYSAALKKQNLWYWKPVGGESLATGVSYRVHSVLDNLRRLEGVDSVIGVTHGEFIRTVQFILERMTPEEWLEMDENPEYSIKNCMAVHYSRIDPVTGVEHPTYKFRRFINTSNPLLSPENGNWKELHTRKYTDEELLAVVNMHLPLLPR